MRYLSDVANFKSGVPLARIITSNQKDGQYFRVYTQNDIDESLTGFEDQNRSDAELVCVDKNVSALKKEDVVFNLVTGSAGIVRTASVPMIISQNFIKIRVTQFLHPGFLVYLLNEHPVVTAELKKGLQGSTVMKYSLKQLKELKIPELPPIETQKKIASVYFKQLRLTALKKRVADLERTMTLAKLQGGLRNE